MLSKKLIILGLVYSTLCLIGITIYTFVAGEIPSLLASDVFLYQVYDSLTLFFSILPSILVSVFFVVVATYIDKESNLLLEKKSKSKTSIYSKILLHIGAIVILLFCCAEVVEPILFNSKKNLENKYVNYNWYVQKSTDSYADGDINSALHYIDAAKDIHSEDEELIELKTLYELSSAKNTPDELVYFPELSTENLALNPTSMNVYSLLLQAQESFANKNYLDAHYYASIGLELGTIDNPNAQELQQIASESWQEIAIWSGFDTDSDMDIFSLKREGYAALMSGDPLTAYYIFLDLWNNNQYDPDIMRYYDLSKQALLNQYFFIDETKNLAHFEKSKNVEFSIVRQDGVRYEISIGGITNVNDTGIFLKYLRDYSCTVYDKQGNILSSFSVPYAKLIGEPVFSFNDEVAQILGFDQNTIVPRLLLTSVDRNTKGIISEPNVSLGQISMLDETVTVLPMELSDFDLILDASVGPQYINLGSLYNFIPKSGEFGFSNQIYSGYFLKRISYPFLLFSVFLFLVIIAWNYRLKDGTVFRAYWLFIIPAFSVVAEYARILIDYMISLFALACARLNIFVQVPLIIAIFAGLIILFSIRFLHLFQKAHKK